jgi:hypothetical protein
MAELHVLTAHLRRVRSQLQRDRADGPAPGRHVRLTAGRMAYVDLLVRACRLLQLPTALPGRPGMTRDLEVLRVEAVLARHGAAL